jgi:TonB-dependent receptor
MTPCPPIDGFPLSRSRCYARPLLLILFLTQLLGFAFASTTTRKTYDIPPGDAATTLRQFVDQSGEEVVYLVNAVRGSTTTAVHGTYTPREALDCLLANTPFAVEQDPQSGALSVRRDVAAPNHVATDPAGATASDATDKPGGIEGRVFDPSSGRYLNNAQVVVEAQKIRTVTDEYGRYKLSGVHSGSAAIKVFYTGLPAITQVVTVTPGQIVRADFNLAANGEGAGNATVKLDAFVVEAARDMTASDLAVNEQRFASSIKSVVSTDSFGDIAAGNVGEFVKFMPGVTVNRNGPDGRSISIGGVPSSSTPIMIDGNAVASASSSNPARVVELEQISITNMSRVEVSRSQNPDSPATAIGGSVNLVSKSAFERARPEYLVKAYGAFRGGEFGLRRTPGPLGGTSYPVHPNFEVSAVVPLSANLGFSFSGLASEVVTNSTAASQDWVPNGVATSANFPVTTADKPYLARFRLADNPVKSIRQSMGFTADYRVTPNDVLSVGLQYSFFHASWWGRTFTFDVGRVASFGPDFTQGVAGAGFTSIGYGGRDKAGTTFMPSFRYRHTGSLWKFELGGAYSQASNHYRDLDQGFFQGASAFLRNVTIRFNKPGYLRPESISVTDASGAAVDPYLLQNYNLESGSTNQYDSSDKIRSLNGHVRRDFDWPLRFTAKVGLDYRSQQRDMKRPVRAFTYVGPDGIASTADNNAAQWFDPNYSRRSLALGFPQLQWMDLGAITKTYKTNPNYFTDTEAQEVNYYRSLVTTNQGITEEIIAPYLRLDAHPFTDRLTITGGVRYERTSDKGEGGLVDPSLIYQRDANGQIVLNSFGKPIAIAPLSSLAGTKLAYIERGAHTTKTYGEFFPSVNLSYNILPNLVARLSYAQSIARPDFNNILPSANIPDPASSSRLITITNPNLKPWKADSYGASLEYYFQEPISGVASARVFQRDLKDFWGTKLIPATDDILAAYGLDPSVYGAALGYSFSTKSNTGDAKVSGMEFDYRQNLTFLPRWAQGFTIFGNATLQHLEGSTTADFSEFISKTINYGLSFSRSRVTLRINVNLQGLQRGIAANSSAEPGTFLYLLPRRSADVTAEFRLTRNFSIFASGRNVNNAYDDNAYYGPSTPGYARLAIHADYRAYWNVGFKGRF